MTPSLSVVIPAYNEAKRIDPTLDRLLEYLRSREATFEILVVDDGSRDGTRTLVEARNDAELSLLRSERNEGKGAAVRRGLLASRGERVLFTDADLAVPIEELENLESVLRDDTAIACASKALPDSRPQNGHPTYRKTMSRAFNSFVRLLGLTRLKDTQCGFKLLRGDAARDIAARCRINGFTFDVELLHVAERLGYPSREVAVAWRHDPASRVHPARGALRVFSEVLWIRLASWTGKYDRAAAPETSASSHA